MTLRGLATPVALFAALVRGYANPGSCSGACNVHDPSLIQRTSDGMYFRFSTGNKISYASASSIKGPWTTIGSMLPSGSSIDLAGNTDLWVRFSDGRIAPLPRCFLFDGNLELTALPIHLSTGSRCAYRRWYLLRLLFCVDIWIAEFGHRPCNLSYHGVWLLDGSW